MSDIRNQRSDSGGRTTGAIRHFSDLIVWQKSFDLGLKVYAASRSWPKEEKYAPTDREDRLTWSVSAYFSSLGQDLDAA